MKTKTPKAQSSPANPKPAARTGGIGGGNGKAHFALEGIQANEVFVAGDFNGWDPVATPLQHNGDGRWAAEIQLPPGRHEYQFVVDGRWWPDPVAERTPNPYGGENSVITVADAKA